MNCFEVRTNVVSFPSGDFFVVADLCCFISSAVPDRDGRSYIVSVKMSAIVYG